MAIGCTLVDSAHGKRTLVRIIDCETDDCVDGTENRVTLNGMSTIAKQKLQLICWRWSYHKFGIVVVVRSHY